MRIVEVGGDEGAVDQHHALEDVSALWDDFAPGAMSGVAQIDGDHASARRVEVGAEIEDRTVVGDEAVARVEGIE